MGRHTMLNPKTGRYVFVTGRKGRELKQKEKKGGSKKPTKKPTKTKKTCQGKSCAASRNKCYASPGSTKRASPLFKACASGDFRPSARAFYDAGNTQPQFYNGKLHVMDFRDNGSPYYRPLKL